MDANLVARFRAVETLQRLRDRHPPGSARFDELDHAIDLALQEGRTVDAFLVRNVIRDAERILRRRRRRQRLILESDYRAGIDADAGVTSLADLLSDPCTPEAEAIALELAEQALIGRDKEQRDERVLACLFEGRTTRETAQMAKISPAYASKLSRQLKDAVAAAATPVGAPPPTERHSNVPANQ